MSQIENQTLCLFNDPILGSTIRAAAKNAEPEPEMVSVDAKALREVLQALISPGPAIRELMMLRGSSVEKITGVLSPISLLVKQYDEHCENGSGDAVVGTANQGVPGGVVTFTPLTLDSLNGRELLVRRT